MNKNYNFEKLIHLINLERSEISTIYFYAILSGLIQLSLPLGIQAILGFVLGATMVTSVYILIFILILAVVIVGFLRINKMKLIEKIQQKIFVRFALDFSEKIPKLDLKSTDNYYLPEKINRFFDTLNVQKGISKLLLDIPGASIQILFGLILLSLYHPLFIVFSLILIVTIWIIFKFTSRKGLKTSILESDYKYEVIGWLEEIGRVIKSFKFSQGSHLNLIKTDEKLVNYLNARTSHFQVLLFQFKTIIFFKVSITSIMLILGTYLLFGQKINIGQFVAAEILILSIISATEKLITSLENVYDVITGLYKLDSLLELQIEKEGNTVINSESLNIEMKNVSFSYNDTNLVFSDLSLKIPSHSITCISGDENSGKSTLLKLLTGSYLDFKGSISFNDVPLQNYSLENLRRNMGILLYEQDIFAGSLFDNITLGRKDLKIEHILEESKKLGFENLISFFPYSYDTQLDPQGRKLPTSLVRKILLLRALIHQPLLIILEEPWIGFDKETTTIIQEYLLKIAKTRTIIISTNDSNFAEKCTNQFNLVNGTIQQ